VLGERALLDGFEGSSPTQPTNPSAPESMDDDGLREGTRHLLLLSGIAAAEGLPELALLLNQGDMGRLRCAACNSKFSYAPYGGRIAIYAEPPPDTPSGSEPESLDFMEGVSSRADSFIVPAGRDDISDPRMRRLLDLADRSPYPEPGLLLRNFLGRIVCTKCGTRAAIRGGGL
jgi:hypothetical protein